MTSDRDAASVRAPNQIVDATVVVGRLRLPNPVMTASGTYGIGTEFAAYGPLSALGAVVTKSLSARPWPGNAAPRLHPLPGGSMINAVGLDNPGVDEWIALSLPALVREDARVVASLWGRTIEEYGDAATRLVTAPAPVAWEVNLSCPNLEDPRRLFAHDAVEAATVIAAVRAAAGPSRSIWAKLSPNATDIPAVAAAVHAAGADAVTLVNTLSGLAVDVERREAVLANRYGGVSGPALHAVALRAVHQVRTELPDLPIIGVGGIATGTEAVAMLMAGADAVQVGTASFADPRAPHRVLAELVEWCARHRTSPRELKEVSL